MNKKNYKYIGIAILLIFILKNVAKGAIKNKIMFALKNFDLNVRTKLFSIIKVLEEQGLNELQIKLALSQILFETGEFTPKSKVYKLNNNYTGIKWINKPYQVATKGSDVPINERVPPANTAYNFYAKFNDDTAWAKDYIRVLMLNKKNPPLNANSIEQYHARLTANKYYNTSKQKNIDNYLNGLKKYYIKIV